MEESYGLKLVYVKLARFHWNLERKIGIMLECVFCKRKY
jgi:hypothetical protein